MTALIVWHSVLQLAVALIVVAALGLVVFVGSCAAHDTYAEMRNRHGIPPAQPPRREPPRRLDRWQGVPMLGVFLTHGHPNGLIVAVPVAAGFAVWYALAVRRRRQERRAS